MPVLIHILYSNIWIMNLLSQCLFLQWIEYILVQYVLVCALYNLVLHRIHFSKATYSTVEDKCQLTY